MMSDAEYAARVAEAAAILEWADEPTRPIALLRGASKAPILDLASADGKHFILVTH